MSYDEPLPSTADEEVALDASQPKSRALSWALRLTAAGSEKPALLDVGCAIGYLSEILAQRGFAYMMIAILSVFSLFCRCFFL